MRSTLLSSLVGELVGDLLSFGSSKLRINIMTRPSSFLTGTTSITQEKQTPAKRHRCNETHTVILWESSRWRQNTDTLAELLLQHIYTSIYSNIILIHNINHHLNIILIQSIETTKLFFFLENQRANKNMLCWHWKQTLEAGKKEKSQEIKIIRRSSSWIFQTWAQMLVMYIYINQFYNQKEWDSFAYQIKCFLN